MLIFYNKSGNILFTVDGNEVPVGFEGDFITVADSSLGDLRQWRISDGNLVNVGIDPYELRETMSCTRLQGRIALGQTVCASLDTMAKDLATPWAMAEAIVNAGIWYRTSPTMDELGWLMGFSPEQMDSLFTVAATINV